MSWATRISRSPGSKSRPRSPSSSSSSYRGRRAAIGTACDATALCSSAGAGWTPVEAKTMTSAWSSTSAWSPVRKRTRSVRSRRSSGCVRHSSAISVARHGGVMGSRRSARRNRRWAARSSSATKAISSGPERACGADGGRARAHELVRRREPTRHELARGRPRRRAGVQPAEEQLHHPARDLRGDEPLGGGVERADVQRPRVAQRRRGHAGRERLMHVHEVEGDAVQQLLDRARDVDRHRGRPARRAEGQHLAHAEHAHPVQRHLAGAHGAPRGVHEVERVRGCDDRDLVPALHEPLRGLADEGVDLVAVLPGVRRDLRDAESGHRPEG